MRLTLNEEIRYAVWRITGLVIHTPGVLLPCISREIAEQTGKDAGQVDRALKARIKDIIRDDVSMHYRMDRLSGALPAEYVRAGDSK